MIQQLETSPDAAQALAYHEAGHAVIAHTLGMKIGTVTILPNSKYRANTDIPHQQGKRLDLIRMMLAGAAANVIGQTIPKVCEASFNKLHALGDYRGAFKLMREGWPGSASETDERLALVFADVIGTLSHHRREIDAIAAALLEKHELSGDEIKSILGGELQTDRPESGKVDKEKRGSQSNLCNSL
jgi:ATP-dependent Zn protease